MGLLLDSKAVLGEGPSWDAQSHKLYWVDIERHQIHIYDPDSKRDTSIDVGDYIGAVAPRASGGLVMALRHGFYHLDVETNRVTLLREVEGDVVNNRFNDGKCDALGRFWAGTMDLDESSPTGALYCLDSDLSIRKVLDHVTISNGLGWSPDNTQMYHIDTPTRQIAGYDFDLSSGTIQNKRIIATIEDGFPDGMTVDAEGMIWVAHWNGYKVSRWDPNTGAMLQEIRLPVSQVTSCAFGGPTLHDLYITTAGRGLTGEALEIQPSAGGLFRYTLPVKGQPTFAFKG